MQCVKGRFGNQADQFLGSLGFSRALNRTLVLPAWVEYHRHQINSVQVPFDTYFQVEPLRAYHRVITMETFMKKLSPTVWPPGSRTAFCYSSRQSTEKTGEGCHAKEGNPFGPFWDTYNIDFDKSEFFGPLYYATESPQQIRAWTEKYTPAEFPVLAFTGPPAPFPVQKQHVRLQQYLKWSDKMAAAVQEFIVKHIPGPFLGLHLRNGIDFPGTANLCLQQKNACEHIKTTPAMFAAAQCVGYRSEFGTTTYQMCYPDDKTVVKQVKKEVKRTGAHSVFVKFVRQPHPADPMLDLAILGQADHFIGNCISTFTAFVKRERDASGKTSSFWAFTPKSAKDEL
ncbi:hypothetical protein C0Q70_17751 [Pomacea canaliculata]|uniref:GDP-fucose protein O-fucosyltransferase 1 n=1 Tax=Pomacea canaliculata TaxID=400727 RepID=A0A2T7NLA3_POMCA|nr:hypothetical protein C0Q70_17751 [Pomacea canaliculata]